MKQHHLCIIGGSGFVGRSIARNAVRRGYQVTVACRHPQRARNLLVEGVRLAAVDVIDGRGLDAAVEGTDVVIYLVGILFEKGRSTFEAAHVHGTEHVLAACKRAGIRRYVHMSALGAGRVPASAYARTKAEAEGHVRQSGLDWTIFRPSIIYGAGDSFFNKFKKLSAIPPFLPVVEGNAKFQPVWVEDVARAFLDSIDHPQALGEIFELGGPRVYTFRELLEILMRELGRKRLLIPLPRFAANLMAVTSSLLPTPILTRDQLALLRHDNVVQGEAFPAIFGEPANLEDILPTYIHGSSASQLQQQLDLARQNHQRDAN